MQLPTVDIVRQSAADFGGKRALVRATVSSKDRDYYGRASKSFKYLIRNLIPQ